MHCASSELQLDETHVPSPLALSELHCASQVVTLLIGGGMALDGAINAQELTSYVMYVEFVTAASLSVCDQWGPFMEALGASERVIGYLDLAPAPQIASGVTLPAWSGRVRSSNPLQSFPGVFGSVDAGIYNPLPSS